MLFNIHFKYLIFNRQITIAILFCKIRTTNITSIAILSQLYAVNTSFKYLFKFHMNSTQILIFNNMNSIRNTLLSSSNQLSMFCIA